METKEQAKLIAKALDDKKGLDIKIIKISDVSVLADYMVIATGTSSTHVKALADEVEYQLDEAGFSVSHIEGHRGNGWILLDYIDIMSGLQNEKYALDGKYCSDGFIHQGNGAYEIWAERLGAK